MYFLSLFHTCSHTLAVGYGLPLHGKLTIQSLEAISLHYQKIL